MPKNQVQANLDDMEVVIREWQKIKKLLASINKHPEITKEWEELSKAVGIGTAYKLDSLASLVFKIE